MLKASKAKCGLLVRYPRFGLFSLLVRSPEEMKILPSDIHGCEYRPMLIFLCHLVSRFKENIKADVTVKRSEEEGQRGKKEGRKGGCKPGLHSSFFLFLLFSSQECELSISQKLFIYDSFILKSIENNHKKFSECNIHGNK